MVVDNGRSDWMRAWINNLSIGEITLLTAIITGVFSIINVIISRTGNNETKPKYTQIQSIKQTHRINPKIEDYSDYLPDHLETE